MSVPYGKMGEGDDMEPQPQPPAPPPTVPAVVIPAAPVQIQQVTTVPGITQPAQPPESKLSVKYAKVLSILQVFCGCIAGVTEIAAIIVFTQIDHYSIPVTIGHGIWCGIFFLIAGIIGLAACGKPKKRSLIIALMVLSIVAAVFAGALVIASSIYIAITGSSLQYRCQDYNYSHETDDYAYTYDYACQRAFRCSLAAYCIQLLFGITEMVSSIWVSALCCKAVCCQKTYRPVIVYYASGQPPPISVPMTGGQTCQQAGHIMQYPGTQIHPPPYVQA